MHIITFQQPKTTFLNKEKKNKNKKMEENTRERNNHDVDFDDDVEDQEVEERSPTSSAIGGSRWNPTKEQIEMLERMYSNEGVRTPSAEQIQQITARLRVYGHIEGKNVFYWFQNHKARQRQKQRHDRLLAAAANSAANHNFNQISPRFIGAPPLHYHTNHGVNNGLNLNTRPIFPASHPTYHHHFLPNPNVMCSPYYHVPQANLGFYNPPQHHYSAPATPDNDHQGMKKVSSKPSIRNATNHTTTRVSNKGVGVPPGSTLSGYCAAMMNDNNSKSIEHHHQYDYQGNCMGMRTLNLFPVHPTGILEHKLSGNNNNNSAGNSCATSSSSDTNINDFGDNHQHPHFIDFFSSGHASSESS